MPVAACRHTCLLGGQNPASAVADAVAAEFVVLPVKWNNEDLRNLDDKTSRAAQCCVGKGLEKPGCPRTPPLPEKPADTHSRALSRLPPQTPAPLLPCAICYKHESKPMDTANAATAAQAQEALAALLLEGTAIWGCTHHASLAGVC